MRREPRILYEDDQILVCHKEPGMPVQSARPGQQDMESLLKGYRVRKGEPPYIGIIHRLDQPVEGVIFFAKDQKSAAALSKQVQNGEPEKEYLAVVWGLFDIKEGTLNDILLRDGRTNTSRVVPDGTKGAKKASLSYKVELEREEEKLSLVRIRLHTGRHHQIRVQFAHAGHPLYGDRKYGPDTKTAGYCPVALCSVRMTCRHPVTGKRLSFTCEPMGAAFALCGRN